jgi:FkbM family methyltransferase
MALADAVARPWAWSGARRAGGLVGLGRLAYGARYPLECRIRAAATTAYLGDHRAVCWVLGRYKLFVDTRDRGIGCLLMLDGYWEIWLTRLVARAVRKGMVCVDVGANLGYYALLMAELCGPDGKVIAVEPNPATAELLSATLAINGFAGRSEVLALALGDGSRTCGGLVVPHGEPKNAALIPDGSAPLYAAIGPVVEVPIIAFDALAADGPRIDLVKIDAEGAEADILRGMASMLRRDRPLLVVEFNAARPYDARALLDGLLAIYGAIHELHPIEGLRPTGAGPLLAATDGEDRLLVCGDADRLGALGLG